MRRGSAFTLIEVLAALVLAGLLAVIAVASLAGPAKAARMEDQVDRLKAFDAAARERARASESGTLTFDLGAKVIEFGSAPPLRLDDRFEISEVLVGDEATRFGHVEIPISTGGRSPDYAVHLVGVSGERWVVFLGLTGRAVEVDDAEAVREVLALSTD